MTDRLDAFLSLVRGDPRVLGAARLAGCPPDVVEVLLVTTWDGFESLPADLPRLGGALLAAGSRIERVENAAWVGVDAEGSRAHVRLRRVGDLVPSVHGVDAAALHDPHGLVEQWIRCCRKEPDAAVETYLARQPLEHTLTADLALRWAASGHPGALGPQELIRPVRASLRADHAAEAALAARIDTALAAEPGPAAGMRPAGGDDPRSTFESFLSVADGEGFQGDRVLFGEAVKRLRELSKREPVFDQGFVLPTFDAVEAGFALGEAVGGCKPPLVPGVYVGIGVTPKDALEFWAAPLVRDPTSTVACVDDTGERDVVAREAGRDAMFAALTGAIDDAWERLPALIERARAAAKESVDPSRVLANLHLPRSFAERARRCGAGALLCSRLTVALAVARGGDGQAPLVARKLGLAAGRVLA